MQGSIRSLVGSALNVVSQKGVSRALRNVAPVTNEARARDLIDRTNPNIIPHILVINVTSTKMKKLAKITGAHT